MKFSELQRLQRMEGIAVLSADERIEQLEARLRTITKERDKLRAKIEAMEKQEPVGYGVLYVEAANGEEDWDSLWKHRVFAEDHVKDFVQAYSDLGESIGAITVVPLYALPGAQPELNLSDPAVQKRLAAQWGYVQKPHPDCDSGCMFQCAQPAPSVPEHVMRDAERYRYLRARDDATAGVGCWLEANGRVCDRGWLYGDQLDSAIDTCIEMLAAAQEAKP